MLVNYMAAERHESWDHRYDICFIKYDDISFERHESWDRYDICFIKYDDISFERHESWDHRYDICFIKYDDISYASSLQIQGIAKKSFLDSIWPKLQENIYSLENGLLCKKDYSKSRLLSLHYGGILAIFRTDSTFYISVKLVVCIFVYNSSIFVQISRSGVGFFFLGTWIVIFRV